MKNLPSDSVLSYLGSEGPQPSKIDRRAATFDFVSRDSRGCTQWARSTVKPLRVSLVEPVAYHCDSYLTASRGLV